MTLGPLASAANLQGSPRAPCSAPWCTAFLPPLDQPPRYSVAQSTTLTSFAYEPAIRAGLSGHGHVCSRLGHWSSSVRLRALVQGEWLGAEGSVPSPHPSLSRVSCWGFLSGEEGVAGSQVPGSGRGHVAVRREHGGRGVLGDTPATESHPPQPSRPSPRQAVFLVRNQGLGDVSNSSGATWDTPTCPQGGTRCCWYCSRVSLWGSSPTFMIGTGQGHAAL